jgi:hypothetical protein
MNTRDIPASVTVAHAHYAGTYTSTKSPTAGIWVWYPPQAQQATWPHFSVTTDNEAVRARSVTGLDGSVANESRREWTGLHISMPFGGQNGHVWYDISSSLAVSFRNRSNPNHLHDEQARRRWIHLTHNANRPTHFDSLAAAFVQAALAGHEQRLRHAGAARAPVVLAVGPQTAAAFDDESGL